MSNTIYGENYIKFDQHTPINTYDYCVYRMPCGFCKRINDLCPLIKPTVIYDTACSSGTTEGVK